MLDIVEKGPYVPMYQPLTNNVPDGTMKKTPKENWTVDDKRKHGLDVRARAAISYSLPYNIFVLLCSPTKKLVADSDTESDSDTDSSKTDTDDIEKVVASAALIVKTFEKSGRNFSKFQKKIGGKFSKGSGADKKHVVDKKEKAQPTPLTENIIAFPISNGVFHAVHEQLKHFPDCNPSENKSKSDTDSSSPNTDQILSDTDLSRDSVINKRTESSIELLSCPFDEAPSAEDKIDSSDPIIPVPCSLNQDIAATSADDSLGANETLEAEDSPETDNVSVSIPPESASVILFKMLIGSRPCKKN
ncbi:uncharacterized protein LOC128126147 [Lactuca sativa]|uniref:uncharacterized protein LOC128126147 n=1 Tax=Lactuca sativa TaxID=4236 RepID=UPI0022AF499C|nr:uncharacterized protein LOC128126147 [Lactuca sativa]